MKNFVTIYQLYLIFLNINLARFSFNCFIFISTIFKRKYYLLTLFKAVVRSRARPQKLSEIYWKIFVSESVINKVADPELATFLQKDLTQVLLSCEICKKKLRTIFYRTLSKNSHLDVFC